MDDNGHPLVILWVWNAPTLLDSEAGDEVRLIKKFVARFNEGFVSSFGKFSPPKEVLPARIVIVSGRWHPSKTVGSRENCLQVSVASELTWGEACTLGVIHITTTDNKLSGDFRGWTTGSAVPGVSRGRWLNANELGRFDLRNSNITRKRLLRASLRSIEEPVEPIWRYALEAKDPKARLALCTYRSELKVRAVRKYGESSCEARVLEGPKPRVDSRSVRIGSTLTSATHSEVPMGQALEECEDFEAQSEEGEELADTGRRERDTQGLDSSVPFEELHLPDFKTLMSVEMSTQEI